MVSNKMWTEQERIEKVCFEFQSVNRKGEGSLGSKSLQLEC